MSHKRDKELYRAWKRANYLKNRDKEIARKKEYYKTPRGKEVLIKSQEQAAIRDKVKIEARVKARMAIRSGKLIKKPCHCGNPVVDAHHEDYSKPLEVEWLCETHHYELHQKPRATDSGVYDW